MTRTTRGFSFDELIEDTPENLRETLNELISTVRNDRKGIREWGNPYNPLHYHLNLKPWFGSGMSTEYYDQRRAIYEHALAIVNQVRGNFASSQMCEFTNDIKTYIERCGRYKQELKEAQERSRWLKERFAIVNLRA